MFARALYEQTGQVLKKLSRLSMLSKFYLAGGTALALHLGHRKSIDLDFFSADNFLPDEVLAALTPLQPKVINRATGTLDLLIDNVKVSFLHYRYPMIEEPSIYENVSIAGIRDIACMKLTAISSRGAKKDFIDFYFILKLINFPLIWADFTNKYSGITYSAMHMYKSLVYFADAEKDPDPEFITQVQWNEVKTFLTKQFA